MRSRAFSWSQLSSTQVEAQVVVGSSSRQGQFEVQLKLKAVELWSMRFTSLSSASAMPTTDNSLYGAVYLQGIHAYWQ